MSTAWILGIDFGTSNTAAAHTSVVTGAVETLPLTHQGNLMPSAVFVESPDSIMVGDVAINRAEMNPAAYLPSPKRVVGQGIVRVNNYDLPSSVPVAAVLQVVIARATGVHGGQPPTLLALTHPEAWSPREVQVLLDAAGRLGFDPSRVRTVSEPRAAAHYYTRTHTLRPGTKIAVFDFGGGTLDVAVLAATEDGTFSVVAARGDNGLGGKNFDAFIRRWLDDQLQDRNPELLSYIRQSAPMNVLHNLEDSIRRAKELLSEAPSATITVTGAGFNETFQLTRSEFEELIKAPLDTAVNLTQSALADAKVSDPSELEALYLTGGSSRIPLVHERLRALGPIATLDDPKTVVVQGALTAVSASNGPLVQQSQHAHYTQPQPRVQGLSASGAHNGVQVSNSGNPAAQAWPTSVQHQPPHNLSAPSSQRKRRKMAIAGGAAVAVLIVVSGIAFYTSSSAESNASAVGGDGAETTTADAAAQGQTVDAIMATFPTPLRQGIEKCERSGFTSQDALQISCELKDDAAVLKGLSDDSTFRLIMAAVDPAEAKERLQNWKEYENPANYMESSDQSAIATISSGGYVSFADQSTGLMLNTSAPNTRQNAETFVERTELLN